MRRFVFVGALACVGASVMRAQEIGPAHGSLVVVGGGTLDTAILARFMDLAGGRDAPVVIIPTALGDGPFPADWDGASLLRNVGASRITVLHTTDRAVAESEMFVRPIREARGVWLVGGRQWRLADAYLGTRTERELHALLARGGVIGGTSAGATIQGSFLVRGDTRGNEIMIGDHVQGFGFLRNTAVDQHLLTRNRQFDMLEVIARYPELLGIGLDENTAIVVRGDTATVMGSGYVAIYDARRADGGSRFYFLAPGDRFLLNSREAQRPVGGAWRPLMATSAGRPAGRRPD